MGTAIESIFVGVRVIYSVTYSFDHNNRSVSPITGSFAVKLVFVVLMQLFACFMSGAWKSRNVKNEQYYDQPARSRSPSEGTELKQAGYRLGAGRM